MFLFSILFMSLTGIGQALSNSYLMFLVFAFLNAFGSSGVYPLAFIIGRYIEYHFSKKQMFLHLVNYNN